MRSGDRRAVILWLVIILLVSVLLRLGSALILGDRVLVLPGIHDQVSYNALANQINQGKGYSFPVNWYPFTQANTPTAHWSFIYPLFLAAVYQIGGDHPLLARILQAILCGLLSCWLVFLIARRLSDNTTALFSAGLTAVYGYFIYYNAALMTESLFILGILGTIYVCLRLLERPAFAWWILLGFILGVSILLRQTALFLVPVLIGWVLFEQWNKKIFPKYWWHPVLTVLIVMAIILPWTYRNYARYGQFLLLNSNSGYALYASTHPQLGVIWPEDLEEVVVPVPDELLGLNEAQIDRALSKTTMQNVVSDPWRIFRLSLSKSLEYFKFWPSVHSNWISNVVRTLSFGLYAPFMLAGIIISFKRWRQFVPLYLVCLIFAGLHILSWPAPRYRLPSDAIMMVFAGMAVYQLLQYLSSRRKKLIAFSQARNT